MHNERFTGMIAPMVVPFDARGELDEAAFRQEARWLLDQPIDGISSGGSTGGLPRRPILPVTDEPHLSAMRTALQSAGLVRPCPATG